MIAFNLALLDMRHARCRSDVTRAIQLGQCEAIAHDAMRSYRPHSIAWEEYMGADQDGPTFDAQLADDHAYAQWLVAETSIEDVIDDNR